MINDDDPNDNDLYNFDLFDDEFEEYDLDTHDPSEFFIIPENNAAKIIKLVASLQQYLEEGKINGKNKKLIYEALKEYTISPDYNHTLTQKRNIAIEHIKTNTEKIKPETSADFCARLFWDTIYHTNSLYEEDAVACHEQALIFYEYDKTNELRDLTKTYATILSKLHFCTAFNFIQLDKTLRGDSTEAINDYINDVEKEYPHFQPILSAERKKQLYPTQGNRPMNSANIVTYTILTLQ